MQTGQGEGNARMRRGNTHRPSATLPHTSTSGGSQPNTNVDIRC